MKDPQPLANPAGLARQHVSVETVLSHANGPAMDLCYPGRRLRSLAGVALRSLKSRR